MKLPFALLAAALLAQLALPAAAQAPPADDAVRLLEDKGGDVKLDAATTDQDPAGRWAATDLRALDVRETSDEVTFILTVGSLAPSSEAPAAENVRYAIGFRHLDQAYRVAISRFTFAGSSSFGSLEAYDAATGEYQQVGPFRSAVEDPVAGTLSFTVDRDALVDRQGDAPHPEVPLADWSAAAYGGTFGSPSGGGRGLCFDRSSCTQVFPYAYDAMPDAGNGTTSLVPRFGIAQSGHARLYSQVPTRASNGEATTIVYQVHAVNRGPRNETFALAASGVPAGWEVRLPATRLTVPANGSVALPVLLSVPFTHEHGTYQKFLLELRSLADAGSVGRIQLGIRYVNPPQPAGHHSTLWLHALSPPPATGNAAVDGEMSGPPTLSMNALADDPLDSRADVPGRSCGTGLVPPLVHYCWQIPLRPHLELGLDFDLLRKGTISLPVRTALPLPGATLEGSLRYIAPGEEFDFFDDPPVALAAIVPHAPADVPPNSEGTILSADIVATSDGDYVAYQKGAQLYLDLELVATGAQPFGGSFGGQASPAIQPGGVLADLPLNEYHDMVAQVFASNSTLQLRPDGPQDRTTNPGKTLLFNLTLQNDGEAGTFNLELTGIHLPWARIVAPGEQVRLDSGESVAVRVAVQVPTSADKGDTADLVLAATLASDLNVRSLARLFATVDTLKEYPDEVSLVAPAAEAAPRSTPAPGALLLAPCLVALAALLRRRA